MIPDFSLEITHGWPYLPIAGVDEAGCGPWAGPVVAAAGLFLTEDIPAPLTTSIRDSKQLTAQHREHIFHHLMALPSLCFVYGIGEASVDEIDTFNIAQATRLALSRAIDALPVPPSLTLIDGIRSPSPLISSLPPHQCIVKGDQKSLSIAAASILAKVTRDRIMQDLHGLFPQYGWNRNAGYGTKFHQEALQHHGVTAHHRKSFAPIRALLPSPSAVL